MNQIEKSLTTSDLEHLLSLTRCWSTCWDDQVFLKFTVRVVQIMVAKLENCLYLWFHQGYVIKKHLTVFFSNEGNCNLNWMESMVIYPITMFIFSGEILKMWNGEIVIRHLRYVGYTWCKLALPLNSKLAGALFAAAALSAWWAWIAAWMLVTKEVTSAHVKIIHYDFWQIMSIINCINLLPQTIDCDYSFKRIWILVDCLHQQRTDACIL